jgi:short chain dehydrogenase
MVQTGSTAPKPAAAEQAASPPGPLLQKINAALHREPVATIAYGIFWSVVLAVSMPMAVCVLQIRTVWQLFLWYKQPNDQHHKNAYDPASIHNKNKYEMAVVITGCDSGFGKELAFWAADAGYTVFAGCKSTTSWEDGGSVLPDRIHLMAMDVTSDAQVNAAVHEVQAWLLSNQQDEQQDSGDTNKTKKKRVLHALINNAGVGTFSLVDWAEMSDFTFCMEGTFCTNVRWQWMLEGVNHPCGREFNYCGLLSVLTG